jgi:nicotinic acid mononucleotide adenylyltransferase
MVKAAYTVGRFQPPTLGHIRMIDALLAEANGADAFVFISSAKDSLIPSKMKKEYLRNMLTRNGEFPANLKLVDTAKCKTPCGGPLGGFGYLKDRGLTGPDVVLVVGGDQKDKFNPVSAPMWDTIDKAERPSIKAIPREGSRVAEFSSTKARAAVATSGASGLKPFLTDGKNAITDEDVARMADALIAVQAKWPKKKGGSDTVFDEDVGGRRRKTRRNKASSKALYRRDLRSRNVSSKTNRSSYALQDYSTN